MNSVRGAVASSCPGVRRPYRVIRSVASTADTSQLCSVSQSATSVRSSMYQRSWMSGTFSSGSSPASSRRRRICSRRLARYSRSKNPAPNDSTPTRLPRALSSCDPLEQQILAVGGQIGQQPLGRPRRRLSGVESRFHATLSASPASGRLAPRRTGRPVSRRVARSVSALNCQHLGLVDLVDHAAVAPTAAATPWRPALRRG